MDNIIIGGGYAKMPVGWISESRLVSMYSFIGAMNSIKEDHANRSIDYVIAVINRNYLNNRLTEDNLSLENMREELQREIQLTTPKNIHRIVDIWNLDMMLDVSIVDLYCALTKQEYKDFSPDLNDGVMDTGKILDMVRRLLKNSTSIKPIKLDKLSLPKYSEKAYPHEKIDNTMYPRDTIMRDFVDLFNKYLGIGYYIYDVEMYYNKMATNISKLADHIRVST